MKPEILAMYLPQYHRIPENDAFWGEGFTDWVTIRRAKPFYEGHQQPRVPLGDNYYDLSVKENIVWQAQTAREHGIYGFGIYHYWFNNEKNLLTRPAEIILENKDIDIHFFFAWDNLSWRRTWSNVSGNDWAPTSDNASAEPHQGNGVLIEYIPGTETDWKRHFDFLLPFFKDPRYIQRDGKPVFMIFHYSEVISRMCAYWDQLAREQGFKGICPVFRQAVNLSIPKTQQVFYYEPSADAWDRLLNKIYRRILRQTGIVYGPHSFRYDAVWQRLLNTMRHHPEPELWPCGFVNYDDTPRRGKKGTIFKDGSPEKFGRYLSQLLAIAREQQKPYVLLVAWNEWSEGAYLEPDTANGFRYLEAVKKATESL